MNRDKLWDYARLSRMWARILIGVGVLVLLSGLGLEFSDPHGSPGHWTIVAVATAVPTTVLFTFLLRSWMRDGALPSARLGDATPVRGTNVPEASRRDWRTWSVLMAVFFAFAGMALSAFLAGTLGGGGEAEGVVVGVFTAWGIVTLRDVRKVDEAEKAGSRTFYAECRRPVAVGQRLVWR
ncbi:MAG: hypothetical protein U0Y82_03825 [Thermoleophilia bacterium]